MSGLRQIGSGFAPRRRCQSGLTLVETLLTVALSALLMVPLIGWTQFSLKNQADLNDRNVAMADGSLLRTYFLRDVGSAEVALTRGDRFEGCRTSSEPLLVLFADGNVVAYALGAPSDGGAGSSLWRSTCAPDTGDELAAIELVTGLDAAGTGLDCHREVSAFGAAGGCTQVQLDLRWTGGRSASLVATVRVDGEEQLAARITADTVTPLVGRPVALSGATSTDPDDRPLTYAWDFGDGGLAAGPEVEHEYAVPGDYTVTLVIENDTGGSAKTSVVVSAGNEDPVAVIAEPTAGSSFARGVAIPFSAAGSYDPDEGRGDEITYRWDFGDGTTSAEPKPTKTYELASPTGGFPVTLTVMDSAGATDSTTVPVAVPNAEPTVSIMAVPLSGTLPAAVRFMAVGTDEPDMAHPPELAYLWDFGNGETATGAVPAPVTFDATPAVVTVLVVDDVGATATATVRLHFEADALPMRISPADGLRAGQSLRLETVDRYEGSRVEAWQWQVNGSVFTTRTVDSRSVFTALPPGYEGSDVFPGLDVPVTLTVVDESGSHHTRTQVLRLAGAEAPGDLRVTRTARRPARNPRSAMVRIRWTRPTQTDRYELRVDCTTCSFSKVATFGRTSSGRVTGLPRSSETYALRIRSRDSVLGTWGEWSDPVGVTT